MSPLFRRSTGEGRDPWIVVGLGNPGARYERTRHNAGALALDELVARTGGRLVRHRSGCLVSEQQLAGRRAILARPLAFMNESGGPVGSLVRYFKAPVDHVIVLHDEMDIPFGRVRVKSGGGTAGHNGLRSVASHLRSSGFVRVRIGIGRPRRDAVDHVLDEFSKTEGGELPDLLSAAADAVVKILSDGVDRAMNDVNVRAPASE